MKIAKVTPKLDYCLHIVSEDRRTGMFNVSPYWELEAFTELRNQEAFVKVRNGGYFIEWDCGADLSADTIEAHLKMTQQGVPVDVRTSRG